MFSSNFSNNKYQVEKIHNSNKYKYVNSYLNDKTIWQDQYPPDNIEKIYKNCTLKMGEIKNNLENLDAQYCINGNRLFETLNTYSTHLLRLKTALGLNEIKSAKTISDVIKIINNNIKHKKREQRKAEALAKEQKKSIISIESKVEEKSLIMPEEEVTKEPLRNHSPKVTNVEPKTIVDDAICSEEDVQNCEEKSKHANLNGKKSQQQKKQLEQKSKLDFTNTMNYLQKRRVYLPEEPNAHLIKKTDSIITPMLANVKRSQVVLTKETEIDVKILEQLLETTLKAFEDYAIVIKEIEKLCIIFEKYFLSFYAFIECYLPKKVLPSSTPNEEENNYSYSKKPNNDSEKNR